MKFNRIHTLLIFIFLVYVLFPTNNSTIDAYYYAACIKYGKDLFHPHHLLYNFLGYILVKPLIFLGFAIDVLRFMKIINSIFAVAGLYIFASILKLLNKDKNTVLLLTFLAASCFGFMRFATEDENYIIPVVFSLAGSYYFLKFINNNTSIFIFLSGFWASLACLFHQIHIFWLIGLLIGLLIFIKNLKKIMVFILPCIMIPVTYIIIFYFISNHNFNIQIFFHFLVRDYIEDKSCFVFEISKIFFVLFLSLANFLRSFIQVHGIILFLVNYKYLYLFPVFVAFTAVILVIFVFQNVKRNEIIRNKIFIKTHLMILILQFLFAVFSIGNAEFMVMIPFLFLFVINEYLFINNKILLTFALTLFFWNFIYGIFPLNHYKFNDNFKLVKLIKNNPEDNFILSDDNLINNQIYYFFGSDLNKNLLKSPSNLSERKINISGLDKIIMTTFKKRKKVFTDCIDKHELFSRSSLLENNMDKIYFKKFNPVISDTLNSFFGKQFLYQLKN